jgi:hypothetical protein
VLLFPLVRTIGNVRAPAALSPALLLAMADARAHAAFLLTQLAATATRFLHTHDDVLVCCCAADGPMSDRRYGESV